MSSSAGTLMRLVAGLILLSYAGVALVIHHSDLRALIPAMVGGYLMLRGSVGRDAP